MENSKMQFVLEGFNEVRGCRIFTFQGIAADRSRTAFTVSTDLGLSRRYGIRLQELPLLCRAVLERLTEGDEGRAFTYTEADMSLYAGCAAARDEAARRKKPPRRVSRQGGAEPTDEMRSASAGASAAGTVAAPGPSFEQRMNRWPAGHTPLR